MVPKTKTVFETERLNFAEEDVHMEEETKQTAVVLPPAED